MPPSEIAIKAAKRAAKKVPKKAGKKAPHHGKHHGGKHHEGKDLRRAYEHLGRLVVLEASLASTVVAQVRLLTQLAEASLLAGEDKSAADLLRAGEHLAFGSLAAKSKAKSLSASLEAAINAEYEHLVDKAQDHWRKHEGDRPAEVEGLNLTMTAMAETAMASGAYRRALEFARGAEALSHVRGGSGTRLEAGALEPDKVTVKAKRKNLKA